jgi:hypothetical protein
MNLSFLDNRSISREVFQQIRPGDVICYVLAPYLLPIDPLRQWHGRVLSLDSVSENVLVTILDAGYGEETEQVHRKEIIAVSRG